MFISAPAKKEKLVSYAFSAQEGLAEQFQQYLEFARVQWERDKVPSPREVLPLILESALRADKGFAKWLKTRDAETPPTVATAAAPEAPGIETEAGGVQPASHSWQS